MNEHEFHRRRSERQIDFAMKAANDDIAQRHLTLARLHQDRLRTQQRSPVPSLAPITRTDKEA